MSEIKITLQSDIIKANLAKQLGEFDPEAAIQMTEAHLQKAVEDQGLQVYTKGGLEALKAEVQNTITKAEEPKLEGELQDFFKGLVKVEVIDRHENKEVWVKKVPGAPIAKAAESEEIVK